MSNELDDQETGAATVAWSPSPYLHGHLMTACIALLVAAALSVVSTLWEVQQPKVGGITVAHALGWAVFFPLYFVFQAYRSLGREADSKSLSKSSLCVFGALVVVGLFDVANTDGLPRWGQISAWVVFGIGMLGLCGAPFVADQATPTSPKLPEPTSEEASTLPDNAASSAGKFGLLGGFAAGLLILLKVLGKGHLLVKFLAFRWFTKLLPNVGGEVVAAIAFVLLLLLTLGFIVWFAIAKIRLRSRLGNLALLTGLCELFLLVAFAGMIGFFLITVISAAEQPGIDEKEVDRLSEQLLRDMTWASMGATLGWTALTLLLFLGLRGRFNPDREWRRDLEAV